METIQIDVANLQVGMYVSKLDRPWLETPFLFQGFEIRETSEIKQLQECCHYVFVDVKRGRIPLNKLKRLSASKRPSKFATRVTHSPTDAKSKPKTIVTRASKLISRLKFSSPPPDDEIQEDDDDVHTYEITASLQDEALKAKAAFEVASKCLRVVLADVSRGQALDIDTLRKAANPLLESVLRNPAAMTWFVLLQKWEGKTDTHAIASAVWAAVLGRHLGFDRETLDKIVIGALLLDIGNVRVSKKIYKKDSITDGDRKRLEEHVELGLHIIQCTPNIPNEVSDMIASHHERYDGSGYPNGLRGAKIPVFGRIAGIVDCYDAMTTKRSYAKAMSSYEAIRELNQLADKHFHAELVEQFVQALGMFPAGSLVELNTGEIGIVYEQNRVRRLRPKIILVLGKNRFPLSDYQTIDLAELPSDARLDDACWIETGHEPGAFGIDAAKYFLELTTKPADSESAESEQVAEPA